MCGSNKRNAILAGAGVAVIAAIAIVAVTMRPGGGDDPTGGVDPSPWTPPDLVGASGDVRVEGIPGIPSEPIVMTVPAQPELLVSVVVDLFEPAKVVTAARSNPWLSEVMGSALGRGFVGSWAGFFGARGEDLGGAFSGTLFETALDKVFDQPVRVLWLGADYRRFTPVLVVPKADSTATWLLDGLAATSQRGQFVAANCPGGDADAISIARIVVADQAIYATKHGDTIYVGRHPNAVLHGVCAKLDPMERTDGAAFEVAVSHDRFDRGVQSLLIFAGVTSAPKLVFGIEGDRVVPRGIRAGVKAPRLVASKLPASMLETIPAKTPILFALTIELPEVLDKDALAKVLKGGAAPGGVPRTVAFLWTPHVDKPDEVAIVWSRPGDRDRLRKIFSPAMKIEPACGHLVLSTSADAVRGVDAACKNKGPSLAHAAPKVRAGLEGASSVVLGIDLGGLTNHLFLGAWGEEQKRKDRVGIPADVGAAASKLEELPFFGFTGTVEGDRLVPGGFSS